MALSTYAELQAEIALWLNRQDLTAQIPTFIRLVEAQVERQLRVGDMVKRSYATLGDQYIALPTDYLSVRNMQLNVTPVRQLEYMTMGQLDGVRARNGNVAGEPLYYSVVGNAFEVAPQPDDSYEVEIVYYAQIPRLSDQVTTNWLLTKHPDIYLFGALMNAAPYLENDDRIGTWSAAFGQVLEDIRLADERGTSSGSPLKARIKPYGRVSAY